MSAVVISRVKVLSVSLKKIEGGKAVEFSNSAVYVKLGMLSQTSEIVNSPNAIYFLLPVFR